jgi:midasin
MKKFEITKSQLDALIKEEYGKMRKRKAIEEEIAKVQSEIDALNESENIEEVEAGGMKKTSAAGINPDGDAKYEENFEELSANAGGDSVALKEDMDMDDMDDESYEAMFAKIGAMLDAKLESGEEEEEEEEGEELEVTNDDEEEEEEEEIEIPMEEGTGVVAVAEEEECNEEGDMMEEQDGESIVNAAPENDIEEPREKVSNENPMHEGTEGAIVGTPNGFATETEEKEVVSESATTEKEVITESKEEKGNILAEGMDKSKASRLDGELARMAKLAKL